MSESTTIGAAILRHAELQPNAPAVVATGFESLSYRELRDYLARVAACLRQAGFDRETRIAVALPNGPQAALAILAVACSAVAVPIDIQLAAPEVETRLALLRPRAVLVPQDRAFDNPRCGSTPRLDRRRGCRRRLWQAWVVH